MNNKTNCNNCGAPLTYNENYYNKTLICPYCKTQYHIDNDGRFDEYKVEFYYMGRLVKGYVSSARINKIWNNDIQRNLKGEMIYNDYKMFLDLNIIGEFEDEYISI